MSDYILFKKARLGYGGQGSTYRGINMKHGSDIAIKVLKIYPQNEQ